jgi:hypothetical protein
MGVSLGKVSYQGFRIGEKWEVVVKRPGQPLRMVDLPRRESQWALSILTDYFGDGVRASDLYQDFAALTLRRFTEDWEMSESDIENALNEIEILRLRWRAVLARG